MAAPAFRAVLLRSVLVTLALLVAFWLVAFWAFRFFAAENLVGWFTGLPWLATAATVAAGLLLVGVALVLAMPLLVFVSRLFLPDIAGQVRASISGALEPGGGNVDPGVALADAVRFALRSLLTHLILLPLYLIPLVNMAVFASANAYLLGRHHFVLAAQQTRPRAEAIALYRRNRILVIGAGFLVFLASTVPLINLIAPSFAPVLMLRLQSHIASAAASRP